MLESAAKSIRTLIVGFAVALSIVAGLGCPKAPRQRPIKMGDVNTGTGSLEAVRRQLQGTWDLASFETLSPAGAATKVDADGVLSYDEYGNFAIHGEIRDEATRAKFAGRPLLLNVEGRAVIDVANHQIRIQNPISSNTAAAPTLADAGASGDSVREYAFEGDRLLITVKDETDRPTARITWQKKQ
jgi:hypothetical protein